MRKYFALARIQFTPFCTKRNRIFITRAHLLGELAELISFRSSEYINRTANRYRCCHRPSPDLGLDPQTSAIILKNIFSFILFFQ